jgi:hypothetical protein
MNMKVIRIFAVTAILIISLLAFALPVHAVVMSDPDTAPSITIQTIHVNRYTAASGDIVITGLYDIPYTTLPTTIDPNWTADKAFIFRLIATDNVTELGSVTPYAYYVSGYRQGVFSFYFPAATAPAWGQAYIIRISENPALFATPQSWDTTIPTSAYTTLTTQADNQADLADRVITLAHTLDSTYTVTLTTSSGGRTTLSSTGERYFSGAIYGLQAMAPTLYFLQDSPVDYTANTWTTTQFDIYAARFNGTWVGTAENVTAAALGLPVQVTMSIPILLLILGFAIGTSLLVHKLEFGWLIASVLLLMGALLGWIPMSLMAVVYQVMGIYLTFIWIGSKRGISDPAFLAAVWFISTGICLILDGSYWGTGQSTVIGQLATIKNLNIGNIMSVPGVLVGFVEGMVRMVLFDYSFYEGGWAVIRWFWVIVAGFALARDVIYGFASVSAGVIPRL